MKRALLALGLFWSAPLLADVCRDPETGRFVACPEIVADPSPVPEPPREQGAFFASLDEPAKAKAELRVRAYAGGLTAVSTDADASLQPLASLQVEAPLTTSAKGPRLAVQADLTALPGETLDLADPRTFKAIELGIAVEQPLGGPLLFSLYAEGGFASRLATASDPVSRLPGWWSGGLAFRSADGDHLLKVGMGPDQRLSGEWAPAVHVSGRAKVGVRAGVAMYLVGSLVRALDLSAYGYATPARDSFRIGVAVGM